MKEAGRRNKEKGRMENEEGGERNGRQGEGKKTMNTKQEERSEGGRIQTFICERK